MHFAGCGGTGGAGQIEGIHWLLRSYDLEGATRDAPDGVTIDVLFEKEKVSGFSGVNSYQGSYRLSGTNLTIGKLSSTLMAGPQDLMDVEKAYLADLERVESYSTKAAGLSLLDGKGKEILRYAKGTTASLTAGTWTAISYHNGQDAIVSVRSGSTNCCDPTA